MIINKDTPKLLNSTKSNGIIWKVELEDESEVMAWETRTLDKMVSFSVFDFKKPKLLIEDYVFEEKWLLGVSFIKDGIIYLHGFESEFSPVQKGIIAFNPQKKEIIWQNFSVNVHHHYQEGIVVFDSKIFPRKFQVIDSKNGAVISSIFQSEISMLKSIDMKILLPYITAGSTDFSNASKLTYKDLLIVNDFEIHEKKIKSCIYIYKDEELIFKDFLDEDIHKPAFDSFFVWQNKLIYIKNKSEILTYLL